jgi:hypothetical protein
MQHVKDSNTTFRVLAIRAVLENTDKFLYEKLITDFAPILLQEINLELSIKESLLIPQLTKIINLFKDTPLIRKESIKALIDFFNVTIIIIIVFITFF